MINTSFGLDCTTAKIRTNPQTVADVTARQIRPIHLQINPTNRCPLHCKFCSCRQRNQDLVLPRHRWQAHFHRFAQLGARALTITGGGEPLAHPQINELVMDARACGLAVGLVTNGVLWEQLDASVAQELSWCRVSLHTTSPLSVAQLQRLVDRAPGIDWAVNYILTEDFDSDHLLQFVRVATAYSFTHVRISDDLFISRSRLPQAQQALQDSKLTWAPTVFTSRECGPGMAPCLLSLLKPNIGPDGRLYACCGVQYAGRSPALDFPQEWCLGDEDDIAQIWQDQAWFDGSVCQTCYYGRINRALYQLWAAREIKNPEFP